MASAVSITIDGQRTTLRLEPVFQAAISDIAARQSATVADVVAAAEAVGDSNRSSAVRCYVASYYRTALEAREAAAVQA